VRADREIAYEKPPGVIRIIGLGDSFTLGYEAKLEDTFLYLLEKSLHDRGVNGAEVVNLGVSGFGTAEELIMLKEEGFKYSPDMVVLAYFTNDFQNNITSNLYSLQGDSLKRQAATFLPAVGIRKLLYAIPGYKLIAEESQLWNIFRNRISYFMQQRLYAKQREMAKRRLAQGDTAAVRRADSTESAYEARLTARLLDEVYLECQKRQIPFVLVSIPYAPPSSKSIESNIPIDKMRFFDKVIYVDAAQVLAPYKDRDIHWTWQGHWKPWVHHLFAPVLADSVMRHLPLPPNHASLHTDDSSVKRNR
jgi:hypothetical protein